jgi:hypothetical protein
VRERARVHPWQRLRTLSFSSGELPVIGRVDVPADERLLVSGALHAGEPRFVSTPPDALTAGAGTLQGTGSSMSAQNAAAAAPTTGVVPAAADQVSALTAAQFATRAQMYQAVSAQAAGMHETIREHVSEGLGRAAKPDIVVHGWTSLWSPG